MARMGENLTPEQAEIFLFARSGHNILVTGQAGTGKSRVVNVIRDDCGQRGLFSSCNLFRMESLAKFMIEVLHLLSTRTMDLVPPIGLSVNLLIAQQAT